MPTPIIFTITTAGRVAALDAFDNGLTIALTQCAFGSGKYTPTGSETALNTELGRVGLSGGAIESVSATLRFSAALSASTHINAFEIGLFSSTGVLFAVASTTSTTIPLTVVEPNIDTICAFGLVLGDVPASSLTITLDPNAPLAVQLVNQHLGAANPHPQYVLDIDLAGEVSARASADTALGVLVAGKAALAGNSTQIFSAADGVSGKDVVNYDQFTAKTSVATDAQAGIVEKALLTELISGSADKYPDAALLLSGFLKDSGGFDMPAFLGGLQFRTGTSTLTQTEGNFGISFNRPFTTSCDFAIAIYENTGSVSTEDIWFQIVSKSTSGATFYLQSPSPIPSGTRIAHWFAIGR